MLGRDVNSRVILTVGAWLVAAALLPSCSSGGSAGVAQDSAQPAVSVGAPVGHAPPSRFPDFASPVLPNTHSVGPRPPADVPLDQFRRTVNAACAPVGRPPPVSPSQPLPERATEMDHEADRLEKISRRLVALQLPTPVPPSFQTYLDTLKNEILLDRRIARAARANDRQAVGLGLQQNGYNRNRRSTIAADLQLSHCLQDASSS
jgi:hypothetical protein